MKATSLVLLGILASAPAAQVSAQTFRWNDQDRDRDRDRDRERRRVYGASQRYRGNAQVDEMITRAYREVLRREPDASGFAEYRRQILQNGLSDEQMRQSMYNSAEYRNRFGRGGDRSNERWRQRGW